MSIRDEILLTFKRVAESQSRRLAPMTDDLRLTECGLDSVGFMLIVTTLEETVKIDPFDSAEDVNFPVTLREFIALYEGHRA
jgi:acyl carrier protein